MSIKVFHRLWFDNPENGKAAVSALFTKRTGEQFAVTREQFEDYLEVRFETVQPGSFALVKAAFGGAWIVAIDSIYQDYAPSLNRDNFSKMMTECAEILLAALKRLKTKGEALSRSH